MTQRTLAESLAAYADSDYYPVHMPGHKRNPAAGEMGSLSICDITEIDGFDNLHQPEGILLEAQERANALYQAGTLAAFALIYWAVYTLTARAYYSIVRAG